MTATASAASTSTARASRARARQRKRIVTMTQHTERKLDTIKDAVDRLADLRPGQRVFAAADLIEYVQLHFLHDER